MALRLNLNLALLQAALEDLKRTNWRDPGTWGVLPKAVVLVLILVAVPVGGYFADWQAQFEELQQGRQREEQLKRDYLVKKRETVNLDLHKQQLREIDVQFGALLKQLPNRAQMDALLRDINQAGLGRGLQFELFKPEPNETLREFYAELPIRLRVTGSYHDIGAFAADIGQMPRIVTLNDLSLEVTKDGNLAMDAIARTYRYLDDEELAAQRRVQKGAKPAAKGPAKK